MDKDIYHELSHREKPTEQTECLPWSHHKLELRCLSMVLVYVFFLLVASHCTLCVSQVLKYEDEKGRLVLVDDPSKIPEKYRDQVEVVSRGAEASKLAQELTTFVTSERREGSLNTLFLKFLAWQPYFGILCVMILLALLFPFVFKNPLSRLNMFIAGFIIVVFFHVFFFVPNVQHRVRTFTGLVRNIPGFEMETEARVRYASLAFATYGQGSPLNPVGFYARLIELIKLQQEIRIQK